MKQPASISTNTTVEIVRINKNIELTPRIADPKGTMRGA